MNYSARFKMYIIKNPKGVPTVQYLMLNVKLSVLKCHIFLIELVGPNSTIQGEDSTTELLYWSVRFTCS